MRILIARLRAARPPDRQLRLGQRPLVLRLRRHRRRPAEAVSKLIEGITARRRRLPTYDDEPIAGRPDHRETRRPGGPAAPPPRRDGAAAGARRPRRRASPTRTCRTRASPASPARTATTGCRRPPARTTARTYVKPAGGTPGQATDYEHPFADYLETRRDNVLYRASFAEGADGFARRQRHRPQPRRRRDLRSTSRSAAGASSSCRPCRHASAPRRALRRRRQHGRRRSATPCCSTAEDEPPDWLQRVTAARPRRRARQRWKTAEAQAGAARELSSTRRATPTAASTATGASSGRRASTASTCRCATPWLLGFADLRAASTSRPSFYYDGETVFVETRSSIDSRRHGAALPPAPAPRGSASPTSQRARRAA